MREIRLFQHEICICYGAKIRIFEPVAICLLAKRKKDIDEENFNKRNISYHCIFHAWTNIRGHKK